MHRREVIKSIIIGSLVGPFDYNKGFSRILGNRTGLDYRSKWDNWNKLKWVGPEYWGNRLQDWIIKDGKVVLDICGPNRTLHLMPVQNKDGLAAFKMQIGIETLDDRIENYKGCVGFRIGAKGPFEDYRSASVFGKGLDIGLTPSGKLKAGEEEFSTNLEKMPASFQLSIVVHKLGMKQVEIAISVLTFDGNDVLYEHPLINIDAHILAGNIALLADLDAKMKGEEFATFAFSDWRISSPDLIFEKAQIYGPVCFAQYTLHRGVLKLTAQFTPIESIKNHSIYLEFYKNGQWEVARECILNNPGRAVNFRIEQWNNQKKVPYRIRVVLPTDSDQFEYYYEGSIAAEPNEKAKIKLGIFSCNFHYGFPDGDIYEYISKLNPDVVAFLGDQFYEGTGGFGAQYRGDFDKACLDYLRKWLMFGWSYREIFRHIPCAIIPDDHDVYHGNVWGESGKAADITEGFGYKAQDSGGYKNDPSWVNMVQFTQTSHLPDPYDSTPVKQGIGVYYTQWNYGGISFAILEDRKFKSAPKNILPEEAQVENGWILNDAFEVKQYRDLEAELLGSRQEYFLQQWAEDWSNHAMMKVVLSQTNFATVATLPAEAKTGAVIPSLYIPEKGEYIEGDKPTVDMDSNGWPPPKRDKAIEILRKAFAFHIAGDQHLATFIQYGIKEHGDSGFAFAGPALNNIWPRRFWPPVDSAGHTYEEPAYVGNHQDGFGNKMTVLAVGNPHNEHKEPAILYNRSVGYGLITFDKKERTIETACYKRFADPTAADAQYPGWPIVVKQEDNFQMKRKYYLPTLHFYSTILPVVKIYDLQENLIYALRMKKHSFQPWVPENDHYQIVIEIPEKEKKVLYKDQLAKIQNLHSIDVIYPE